MKKFLKNIILFFLFAAIFGEAAVRVTHPTSDIPKRFVDEVGIQKYFPNQEGYWKGGDHKWNINNLGWPGELPTAYDNLVVIIGDSYIENFMNPNECHQSVFLKKNIEAFNFIEASRSGVSLIEAMEISKQMDSLNPIQTLIYVNDIDFNESIQDIKIMSDITQVNLKNEKIIYGELKSPLLKNILYNWKLLYYFYTRFPLEKNINSKKKTNKAEEVQKIKSNTNVFKLIKYIKNNYIVENKTLVFHPNSSPEIIKISKDAGFKTISLEIKEEKQWRFDNDPHWTCYGHEQAAKQVKEGLLKNFLISK